ncbi:MAG: 30S ribosomal protein S16 [Candidatus Moraniibacteriota bacterium]|nr:MAG: 30S ribosomal protein S16 [Candidatus Moranbacteria bacterium]
MLIIRFNRTGRKSQSFFRLVVQEQAIAPGGRHVEVVGSWNPHKKEGVFKNERIMHWIKNGAQCSDSVHNLLVSQKIIEGKKRSLSIERPKSEEVPAETVENSAPAKSV